MGYVVFKSSDESKNSTTEVEETVGDSAMTQLTDAQKKTIWEWCKYLGKAVLKAILAKLIGTAS